ncbi:hypothetical protein DEU56DRAFT_790671 [Suillus clintonianus]|uniref:uncharacterized protein n=1 Tax=Suillus clintonianus TaxID=1904413 RepID=UPI001B85D36A|nr:uncharacterized protein DEU56DRAFT_790671 [Suillus clintonianus]KAG2144621.1 hypothetical protein DEU56DRAFT_790671 [Suillus clintonianus]
MPWAYLSASVAYLLLDTVDLVPGAYPNALYSQRSPSATGMRTQESLLCSRRFLSAKRCQKRLDSPVCATV